MTAGAPPELFSGHQPNRSKQRLQWMYRIDVEVSLSTGVVSMKKSLLALSIGIMVFVCGANAAERPAPVFLWPEGAPGSVERMKEPEKEDVGPGKCNVSNIHHPSITPYLVQAKDAGNAKPSSAILICPGGGHRVLCLGHEGYHGSDRCQGAIGARHPRSGTQGQSLPLFSLTNQACSQRVPVDVATDN